MIVPVLTLLLSASPVGAGDKTPNPPRVDLDAAQWLYDRASPPPPDRVSRRLLDISERFLGTAYIHSPLGEGEGVDPDPRIRFDAVDCLTFVEQTIALALSPDPAEVADTLDALRYGDGVGYDSRNHLMEAQWLPQNLEKGFLRNVTRKYGRSDVVTTHKVLTEESWRSESSRSLNLPVDRQLKGRFALEMIPLEKVAARARDIPSGTILLVIREDRPRKVTRVTHLGFVVQKKKRTYLRHAARSHFRAVVDEDLETFLRRNARYAKWPVAGISLYEVRAPQSDPMPDAVSSAEP